jgi:tetratricopeptide (TPR) repeat protein
VPSWCRRAAIHFYRGNSYGTTGHSREAAECYTAALRLSREVGDRAGELVALRELGLTQTQLCRYDEGLGNLRTCLDIAQRIGDEVSAAHTRTAISRAYEDLGDHHRAARELRTAIQLADRIGDQSLMAYGLGRLGMCLCLCHLGELAEAEAQLEAAASLAEEIGDTASLAQATSGLGTVHEHTGDYERAVALQKLAIEQLDRTGVVATEQEVRLSLADTYRARGHTDAAAEQYLLALRLSEDTGHRLLEARAHEGLAHCASASGAPTQTREHRLRATAIYHELRITQPSV